MSVKCLACGKPLGSSTELCHLCKKDGITLEDVVEVDESDVKRVERYFLVSSIRCANCGGLHGEVTVEDETYTAADFGIETEHDWELEMDKEEEWLQNNARVVRAVLPRFESEWPQTVYTLRTRFFDE